MRTHPDRSEDNRAWTDVPHQGLRYKQHNGMRWYDPQNLCPTGWSDDNEAEKEYAQNQGLGRVCLLLTVAFFQLLTIYFEPRMSSNCGFSI